MSSRTLLMLAALLVPSLSMQAQTARTVRDGVYTDAQAARGAAIYKEKCASCHGPALGRSLAPPLAGDAFATNWGGPLAAFLDTIHLTNTANALGSQEPETAAE